ncbi:MAG: nitrilase, partial [Planctomycetes bacterium]|nr:nitrilase [Planctomycetota bacterium]
MDTLRYSAAACQVDLPNPQTRAEIGKKVTRMLAMTQQAVEGYSPFLPVKLLVFPEFAHAAPVYASAAELRRHLTVPIPNEHTERYAAKAAELDVYIQTGTFLEEDPAWPGKVFNSTCLIGPDGILLKYRKVNPWIPFEAHVSPHDLEGYRDEMFPVARTPIGNLGAAICYDWLFPEALRQLTANGAEVLIRVSAYMDPWGATAPMDWWTVVNRCRALENT